MTSKLVHFFTAVLCALSVTALAQNNGSAANLPAAPASAAAVAPTVKIGTINIEQAIGATNEGQRDLENLYKTKLEPKQAELKSMNDELEALKKQVTIQGDKLTPEAHDELVRKADQKQKAFDRAMQDAKDDMTTQQQEIMQRNLQKMEPIMMKYVTENGYGLLIDTTKQWPDGQAILGPGWAADVTKGVVDAYNAQSGVPAPAPTATRPAGTRPSGAAKPATPPAK